MAGKKGMRWGAKIISPTNVEQLRISIEAEKLIAALKDHALGNKEMAATQVTAALGLVRKVLPDMTITDHSGEVTHVISIGEPKAALAQRLARQGELGASDRGSLVSVQ